MGLITQLPIPILSYPVDRCRMDTALTPIEQRETEFNGDTITVVIVEDGTAYVPLRPICDSLGVDWSSQRQRLNRDPVLSDISRSVVVTTTQLETKAGRRATQDMTALPLDYLNGWLFGINANRVKADIRDRLIAYQRDCYRVLADAFGRNRVTSRAASIDTSDDPSAVAYRNALAVVNLAREQFMMRQQVDANSADIAQIKAALTNPRAITDAQASQISQAVKAIALELGKRTGGNEFGGVYGELYRRFEISSYKMLPVKQFDEAMKFLSDWYSSLTGIDSPF